MDHGDDAMMTPIDLIMGACCTVTGTTREQIRGNCRVRSLAITRRFFARTMRAAGYSLPEIGEEMNKHHTSILWMLRGGRTGQ
jgi:chromosomal replication initiation ATPase DnaA